ncbi:helix-turn-helix domain-containing protein [Gordonia sp. CPCC 205515]|uniref:TetR/AcrR family transcriptional regulator n=1 Tax=Gordonia sp. CPCC 205515 TaxID=3140791 RepID=UPI003AF3A1A9
MSSRPSPPTTAGRRPRRPADRRVVILRTAAKAFSENGYHAVKLDDIAAAAGLSAPALYRHFPNKYALFAETARMLADALASAVAAVPADADDPEAELRGLLRALTGASVANRRTGGLYHWELDYLEGDDAAQVRAIIVDQHRRIRGALQRMRPELATRAADVLTAAMTSVVASPSTHRATLPARQIVELITAAAMSLAGLDLPDVADTSQTPASGLPPTSKRELLLAESMRLFAAHGFHDVTIDDIARAADLPSSGVYRHYESKSAILLAAFWRASDRVSAIIADALASSTTPREVIVALVTKYVDLAYTTDMLTVYVSEIGNVAAPQRTELRSRQRINVDEWAAWVGQDRPELSLLQARFLVQAVLNLTIDLTRPHRRPPAPHVTAIGLRILLGDSDGVEVGQ